VLGRALAEYSDLAPRGRQDRRAAAMIPDQPLLGRLGARKVQYLLGHAANNRKAFVIAPS
jgi:hypothetical protein